MTFFKMFTWLSAAPAFGVLLVLTVYIPWLAITERLRRMIMAVLFYKVRVGPVDVSLFTILFFISLATLADATRTCYKRNEIYDNNRGGSQDDRALGLKWRAERNFWLAFAATGAWLAVYRLNAILRDAYEAITALEQREAELKELKRRVAEAREVQRRAGEAVATASRSGEATTSDGSRSSDGSGADDDSDGDVETHGSATSKKED